MSIWGKIIGGTTGFALGGPLGALLGAFAGHLYDKRQTAPAGEDQQGIGGAEKEVAFTVAVVALGAKLAKADGLVTKDEIVMFRRVFKVPPEDVKSVARVFNLARRHATGYAPYARQIAGMFRGNPAVLEELLDCLFHIAKADGKVSPEEIEYLADVAQIFGFSRQDFDRIRAEELGPDNDDPYQVLGLTADADDATVKATYRKLVRENHPDRLIAQGMPEDFVEVANDKLAAINAAYDRIEQQRGLS